MRIEQIHIDHFGALSDYDYSFSESCTVFCEPNGWGKTTLSVFLRVMFFGFGRKGNGPRERAFYKPWNGGNYGGSLTFETEGKKFTILRSFGDVKTGRDDQFQLIDCRTGKLTQAFSERIGEELFGINEDSFLRTACMMQDDCSTDATSDITSLVGAGTCGDRSLLNDIEKYDEISQAMNEQLNRLSEKRSSGLIFRKKQEILQVENALRKSTSLDHAIAELEKKKEDENTALSSVTKKLKQLSDRQSEYSIRQDSIVRYDQYCNLKKEYQRRKAEKDSCFSSFSNGLPDKNLLQRLILDSEELAKLEERVRLSGIHSAQEQNADRNHLHDQQIHSGILILIGAAIIIGGILLGFPDSAVGSFLFCAGAVAALCGLLSWLSAFTTRIREDSGRSDTTILPDSHPEGLQTLCGQNRGFHSQTSGTQQQNQAMEQLKELKEMLSAQIRSLGYEPEEPIRRQLLQIHSDAVHAENAENEYRNAEKNLQSFITKNPEVERFSPEILPADIQGITSLQDLNRQQLKLQEKAGMIRDHIEQYERRILTLLEERAELSVKEEELVRMREQLSALEERQWLIRTTSSIMSEARDSYASEFMLPIQEAFDRYYGMIDPQLQENLIIDAAYSVQVKGGGMIRETEVLSKGYRNLASLCLRLALLEAMYKKEKPFLILDDPFLCFDDEKCRRAMQFLTHISGQFQVILFTCSSGRTGIDKFTKNVV